MGRTFCGNGRGWIRINAGMDVKSAGMGGDGTKIRSLCTPLIWDCCMLLFYPTVGSATHNKDCELTVMFVISTL